MSTSTSKPALQTIVSIGLLTQEQVDQILGEDYAGSQEEGVKQLVAAGLLNKFQETNILRGKTKALVFGPYRIIEPIGKGGMGIVYLAEHKKLNRKAAIKVLPKDKTKDKLTLDRFHREARSAATVDHRNIVKAFDVGETHGVHYFVMDYVKGVNLQSYLDQKGAIPWKNALNYISQACAGLQHVHEKGLVHRDIKPGNLIVDGTGTLKILDLGLARCFTKESDNLTENFAVNKEITGSVNFIAPEQAMGLPMDIRGDIYSLGATLYALITGKPPYDGTPAQKLLQHQTKTAPDIRKHHPEVPAEVASIISKMMAKKPEHRFAIPKDVITAITPWLAGGIHSTGQTRMETPALAEKSIPRRVGAATQMAPALKEETIEEVEEVTEVVDEPVTPKKKKKKNRPKPKRKQASFNFVPILTLLGVLVVVGLVGWGVYALINSSGGKKNEQAAATSPTGAVKPAGGNAGTPSPTPPPADSPRLVYNVGDKAPEIDNVDLDDKRMALSEYKGKVILLDFWGFW